MPVGCLTADVFDWHIRRKYGYAGLYYDRVIIMRQRHQTNTIIVSACSQSLTSIPSDVVCSLELAFNITHIANDIHDVEINNMLEIN